MITFMQRIVLMGACLLSFSSYALENNACLDDYPGVGPQINLINTSPVILCAPNGGFVTYYSESWKLPLFSLEHLTRQHVVEHYGQKRTDSFRPDDRLPHKDRAELSDYMRSGYDRGHMAPDADSWNQASEYDTFVLSNMIPQAPDNNRGLHAHIEAAVRHLAKQVGDIYVYTGPLFLEPNQVRYIHNRIPVPDHIFKLVYNRYTNKAAAYVELNVNGNSEHYDVISAQRLKEISGIDFLPGKNPDMMDLPKPINYGNNNHEHRYSRHSLFGF